MEVDKKLDKPHIISCRIFACSIQKPSSFCNLSSDIQNSKHNIRMASLNYAMSIGIILASHLFHKHDSVCCRNV
jgi:hypothetical protein